MKKRVSLLLSIALLMFSCSEKAEPSEDKNPIQNSEKIPINIATTITKATDTGFEQGDKVGIYVVNHPNTLQNTGNHANNVSFTYSGNWASDTQLYWKDESTKANFYCYYPYVSSISNVAAYPFSVKADQSSESGYKSSDFLWGRTENVSPTAQAVGITVKHLMSNIVVKLVPGNGYTEDDMQGAKVSICGLQTSSSINLSNGDITAKGNVAEITPRLENGVMRALVIPQSVSESNLVKIVIGDMTYLLKQSMTFVSGKQHTCTITVEKTSQGINIGIGGWDVDDEDFGGIVE